MLIQRGLHLLLVLEDVIEASRQLGAALAVEHNLTRANVTVRHALIVHEVERA